MSALLAWAKMLRPTIDVARARGGVGMDVTLEND
jgi:hypothetical protein